MIERGDTNFTERSEFGANIGQSAKGYQETGFNFAFTIVKNDFVLEQDEVDFADYFHINVINSFFSLDESGKVAVENKVIKYRKC